MFTKTQFAPTEIHIAICELLHLIQDKYFPGLQVSDEGEYFQTRDPARLAKNISTLNAIMDRLESALNDEDDPVTKEIRRAVDETEKPKGKKRRKSKLKFERGKKISVGDPLWKRAGRRRTSRN